MDFRNAFFDKDASINSIDAFSKLSYTKWNYKFQQAVMKKNKISISKHTLKIVNIHTDAVTLKKKKIAEDEPKTSVRCLLSLIYQVCLCA